MTTLEMSADQRERLDANLTAYAAAHHNAERAYRAEVPEEEQEALDAALYAARENVMNTVEAFLNVTDH